jgi:hypothetical protein
MEYTEKEKTEIIDNKKFLRSVGVYAYAVWDINRVTGEPDRGLTHYVKIPKCLYN